MVLLLVFLSLTYMHWLPEPSSPHTSVLKVYLELVELYVSYWPHLATVSAKAWLANIWSKVRSDKGFIILEE